MYVIDQNNIGKMYYLYTDHLGSPNLITDAQCNVVEELSFDAWGNRRAPSSWQPYNSTATVPESFIDRGFTFHEHLYPFTLINMNGRAYDPLVGRFLSPDPYIQAPDNTQNLNRYSYCLNNPLKYTDPSGEFIIEAMIIGGMINWMMSGCEFNLKGIVSFGIGALSGVVGAGVTNGVTSVMMNGGFIEGALGLCAATETGFISGFTGGFASGVVSGTTTSLVQGNNIEKAIGYGLKTGMVNGTTSGLFSGISASLNGRNFMRGGLTYQSQLEYLYQHAIKTGVTNPIDGAVGEIRVGAGMDNLAECIPGKHNVDFDNVVFYDDGKVVTKTSYSKNRLVFSRRLIRQMVKGTAPLECINHEVTHANDYFSASWFDKNIDMRKFLDDKYFTTWMEIRAYSINVQNSSWPLFSEKLLKYNELMNKILAR